MTAASTFRRDLFAGVTVLVTGGGRGIGAGVAEAFADCGADLALHDVDEGALHARAESLRARGVDVKTFHADLARKGAAETLMAEVIDSAGQVHVLVNNAGCSWAVTTDEIDALKAESIVELNQMSVLWLCRSFVQHRKAHGGGGSIVQISSTAGVAGFSNRAVYAATKHAMQGLTRVLALDHGADGIRVNSILPHVIETPMFKSIASEGEAAHWSSSIPLRRLGTPDDIAGAALFLCSPAASYISSSSIIVDGGAMAGV